MLLGAGVLVAAERTVAPTFLHRHLPDLGEKHADITTSSCHYKPVFGVGDSEMRIVRGVARYGDVTVDPGGRCAPVDYPREEQIYVVLEGAGTVHYGEEKHAVGKNDYMYLPPGIRHGLSNSSQAPLRVIVMGWKIPKEMEIRHPSKFQIANINDVPLQVVGNHPPSSKFRLLMGTAESKRDRIAAAHVMTSLFIMEFTPGGTNFPHAHPTEEEMYLLLAGKGDIVAGGGMDGVMGKHPARSGDAYFYRLNCTVGFYASTDPGAEKAVILAARSLYPRRR